MRAYILSAFSVVALLGLSACGSDEKPHTTVVAVPPAQSTSHVNAPTKGQQLQDLQKAYDDDIIDEDQFNAQKAGILAQ